MSLPSQAAVIVTFEQSGNDVIARWDGTLEPGVFAVDMTTGPGSAAEGSALAWVPFITNIDVWISGTAAGTTLHGVPTGGSATTGGFVDDTFIHPGLLNGMPDTGVLSFTGGIDYITFGDARLNDIGAASFSNTLAWTSSSGDTIKYTTVPEAGSALLGLVAMGLGSLIRKRRGV